MTDYPLFECIDAGTENCPCYLAESGNCLSCSRLAGKECSSCQWHGVCIYNEYIQNGKVIKNTRQEQEVKIVSKKRYDEETALFVLDVGKGMAMKCFMPGTYIFLRREESQGYFNVPIAVMNADVEKGYIKIMVKAISAKTKFLIEEEEKLFIRGPYKNGVFGVEHINDLLKQSKMEKKPPRILIIAKGIGMAPAEKLVQFLAGWCPATIMLDGAKVTDEMIEDCLEDEPDDYYLIDMAKEEDLELLEQELESGDYAALCLFTSDFFANLIGTAAQELGFEGKILLSNNFNICCGEGICGACSIAGENGETIKMCKCKLSGEEILKRKVIFT